MKRKEQLSQMLRKEELKKRISEFERKKKKFGREDKNSISDKERN